jgi:hypothetical protein
MFNSVLNMQINLVAKTEILKNKTNNPAFDPYSNIYGKLLKQFFLQFCCLF